MLRRTTICALILLAVSAFFAVSKANAQQVWGTTAFAVDTNTRKLFGYHATEVDFIAWEYYQPYVEGFIYDQFQNELDFDDDLDQFGFTAEAFTEITYVPGRTYFVISDHYVRLVIFVPSPGGGGGAHWNPFGFGFSGPGGFEPSWGFGPGQPGFWVSQFIYLGSTGWRLDFFGVPHIDQMLPTSGPRGTTIEVNFSGTDFGINPTVNVSGTGVTADTIQFSTDTRLSLFFNIASNAPTGDRSVTISAHGYTSNVVHFNVGDSTPHITGINPSRGDAGSVVDVTITGTGFGTNPVVNVTGGISNMVLPGSGNQQVNARFTIPATEIPGDHQVTVFSNGSSGTGFVSGGGSSATSNSVTFTVNALASPRIIDYAPRSGQLGTSVEINVTGENFGQSRTLVIGGQGVTVQSYTPVSDPDHQIVALLNIAENAETGNHSIRVSAGGQTSNSVNFQVGDPSPRITSIAPPFGVRGTTVQVQVTGSGFGTNPTLQVSGTGVNVTINSTSNTLIDATFQISGLAEVITRTVTVTSRGAGGNGFIQTPGANPTAQAPFDIQAAKVKINSMDKRFAPSVERLNITYTISPTGTTAPFARLEIFKKGDLMNPIFRDDTIQKGGSNIPYSQGGNLGWDGVANLGPGAGNYIWPEDSPFTVRITIATDGTFATNRLAEKDFKVEIDSIETTPTPSKPQTIVKPTAGVPGEIQTLVTATVKLKNKNNTKGGVRTALPFRLHWGFEDPDDTAGGMIDPNGNSQNDNSPVARNGRAPALATATTLFVPGSVMWRAVTGVTTTIDPAGPPPSSAGQSASTDVILTGADMGSAKIIFLSSDVAGDNYILKFQLQTNTGSAIGTETRFGIWSVRKLLEFTHFYKMDDGVDAKSIASKKRINPAFSGDGYTDYEPGNTQTNLHQTQAPEFVVSTSAPIPAELPTNAELNDYNSGTPAVQAVAKAAIETRAQAWLTRNYNTFGPQLQNYVNSIGAPAFSFIGARYLHDKFDGRESSGVTNFYPAGIEIIGFDGDFYDPDSDWGEIQGIEYLDYAFLFKNTKPQARRIIAARHEIGHASDHVPFGPGDHDLSGLMESTADQLAHPPYGNPFFSDNSILHLRGWN